MGAPPQGMGGPSDEDRKREKRYHRDVIILGIISITVALIIGIPTIQLGIKTGDVLEKIQEIELDREQRENFEPVLSVLSTNSLNVEAGHAGNQTLIAKLSFSSISPYHLKLLINKVEFKGVSISTSCSDAIKIFVDPPIEKYVKSDIGNLDFDVPLEFSADPRIFSPPEVNSSGGVIISGDLAISVEIEDHQTHEIIDNKVVFVPIIIRASSVTIGGFC